MLCRLLLLTCVSSLHMGFAAGPLRQHSTSEGDGMQRSKARSKSCVSNTKPLLLHFSSPYELGTSSSTYMAFLHSSRFL